MLSLRTMSTGSGKISEISKGVGGDGPLHRVAPPCRPFPSNMLGSLSSFPSPSPSTSALLPLSPSASVSRRHSTALTESSVKNLVYSSDSDVVYTFTHPAKSPPSPPITACPNEVLVHILSFLKEPQDVLTCACVCRHWRALSRTQSLWRVFVYHAWPQIGMETSRYNGSGGRSRQRRDWFNDYRLLQGAAAISQYSATDALCILREACLIRPGGEIAFLATRHPDFFDSRQAADYLFAPRNHLMDDSHHPPPETETNNATATAAAAAAAIASEQWRSFVAAQDYKNTHMHTALRNLFSRVHVRRPHGTDELQRNAFYGTLHAFVERYLECNNATAVAATTAATAVAADRTAFPTTGGGRAGEEARRETTTRSETAVPAALTTAITITKNKQKNAFSVAHSRWQPRQQHQCRRPHPRPLSRPSPTTLAYLMSCTHTQLYVLLQALLLLSTDLYSAHGGNKMSKREFIRNARPVLPRSTGVLEDLLGDMYDDIWLNGPIN